MEIKAARLGEPWMRPTPEQIQEMQILDVLDQQRRHFQEKWEIEQLRLTTDAYFAERRRELKE